MKNGRGEGREKGLVYSGWVKNSNLEELKLKRNYKGVWSQVTVCFVCLSMKKILSDRQGGATYNFKQENKIKS